MARSTYDDLSPGQQRAWEERALAKFYAAGHSYAVECPEEDKQRAIRRGGQWAWEEAHRNRFERWSGGWYGMNLANHRSMLKNNYIGHRNSCTYVNGPKFYIPPRRGPWLAFLRWLQVVPPRPLTIKDRANIISEKPFQ
jgi:hypothetical protein